MATTTHWEPNFFAASVSNSGCATAKELTLTFSAPAWQQIGIILNAADASADRKGDIDRFSHGTDSIEHDAPRVRRRSVPEGQLVRTALS